MQELYEEIKMTAYELYEQREMTHGYDFDDWLQAERMVIGKNIAARPAPKTDTPKTNNKERKSNTSKTKKKGDSD